MKNARPEIQAEYKRVLGMFSEPDMAPDLGISVADILRAHYLITDHFCKDAEPVWLTGPRGTNMLESAFGRQDVSFGGEHKWNSLYEIAATLFFGLVKDHPFHDGNKRTALLSALYQMHINGYTPSAPQKEFERITVATAASDFSAYPRYRKLEKKRKANTSRSDIVVEFLAGFFRRSMRPIDKRYYTITFRDLDKILRGFGFSMEDPKHNHIDIVKYEKKKHMFSRKFNEKKVRVCQIGFPNWSSQVGKGAIRTVRSSTGLTPENGYDSQVFYKDLDPMTSLIEIYQGPLLRLADR